MPGHLQPPLWVCVSVMVGDAEMEDSLQLGLETEHFIHKVVGP